MQRQQYQSLPYDFYIILFDSTNTEYLTPSYFLIEAMKIVL